jgi:hypothetical protein
MELLLTAAIALYLLATITDVITTSFALRRGGVETNWLFAPLATRLPLGCFLRVLFAVKTIPLLALWWYFQRYPMATTCVFWLATLAYCRIPIHNLQELRRWKAQQASPTQKQQ